MRRLPILLLATGLAFCGGPELPENPADRVLFKACKYLWSAQADDGGWSGQHGLMKGGEATTAFVLNSLLNAGPNCPTGDVASALDFIRNRVNDEGTLGLSDPDVLDYPNYATALALKVLAKHGDASDRDRIRRMTDYLLAQQMDEGRGFVTSHPAFGGWGFGERTLPPDSPGHVDLSQTRQVLEALRAAGHDSSRTYDAAMSFLRLVQRDQGDRRVQKAGEPAAGYDGGFFASAAVPGVNKSDPLGESAGAYFFTSYATATADGAIGLLAAGAGRGDRSVRDAARWLSLFPKWDYPAGIPRDHPGQWGRVMFYYHIMVRAEAYRVLDTPGRWRDDVASVLLDRQNPDGHFKNAYGAPNKEDDPLIATAMVVAALAQPPRPD